MAICTRNTNDLLLIVDDAGVLCLNQLAVEDLRNQEPHRRCLILLRFILFNAVAISTKVVSFAPIFFCSLLLLNRRVAYRN